jgi:hypothetical protein
MPNESYCINQLDIFENFTLNQFMMIKYDLMPISISLYLKMDGIALFIGLATDKILNFGPKR